MKIEARCTWSYYLTVPYNLSILHWHAYFDFFFVIFLKLKKKFNKILNLKIIKIVTNNPIKEKYSPTFSTNQQNKTPQPYPFDHHIRKKDEEETTKKKKKDKRK